MEPVEYCPLLQILLESDVIAELFDCSADNISLYLKNDDMLKNGKTFGRDYFDELFECIREIRVNEELIGKKQMSLNSVVMITTKISEMTKTFYVFV